jgi:predicted amino acid-binding ACT domain protein
LKNTTRYAITVICEDRVGLVGRFTGAITRLGGNIEVLDQNVRLGYFVITLMATFETGVTADTVRMGLEKIDDAGTPAISVLPRRDASIPPAGHGAPFVLAVAGIDVPGNFSMVTTCLAAHDINVESLACRTDIRGPQKENRFTIIGDLTVPHDVNVKAVRQELTELLADRKVKVTLMHSDIFDATNRIPMPKRHMEIPS